MLVCLSGIFLKKCTKTLLIGLKIEGKLPNFWNLLGLCLQTLSSLLVLALIHSLFARQCLGSAFTLYVMTKIIPEARLKSCHLESM